MATRVQIGCIRKNDRSNPAERITYVGGVNPNGGRWLLTQEQAIAGIESGTYAFFVKVQGHEVDVIVAIAASGRKYLRTKADGEGSNNLLALPECP